MQMLDNQRLPRIHRDSQTDTEQANRTSVPTVVLSFPDAKQQQLQEELKRHQSKYRRLPKIENGGQWTKPVPYRLRHRRALRDLGSGGLPAIDGRMSRSLLEISTVRASVSSGRKRRPRQVNRRRDSTKSSDSSVSSTESSARTDDLKARSDAYDATMSHLRYVSSPTPARLSKLENLFTKEETERIMEGIRSGRMLYDRTDHGDSILSGFPFTSRTYPRPLSGKLGSRNKPSGSNKYLVSSSCQNLDHISYQKIDISLESPSMSNSPVSEAPYNETYDEEISRDLNDCPDDIPLALTQGTSSSLTPRTNGNQYSLKAMVPHFRKSPSRMRELPPLETEEKWINRLDDSIIDDTTYDTFARQSISKADSRYPTYNYVRKKFSATQSNNSTKCSITSVSGRPSRPKHLPVIGGAPQEDATAPPGNRDAIDLTKTPRITDTSDSDIV